MSSILLDPAVVASVVVAVLGSATAMAIDRVASIRIPTAVVCCAAIVAAVPQADFDIDRYGLRALTAHSAWMIAVLALAIVVAIASAAHQWHGLGSRTHLTVALAGFACGLFLYIPETDLLRIAPGPLVVVAVGVLLVDLRPIDTLGLLAASAVLVWLSLVDGATRPGTVLATSAVLGLVSLVPHTGTTTSDPADDATMRVRAAFRLAGLALGIVVVGRVLGTTTSWISSWTALSIVAFAAWTAVARFTRSER